MSSKDEEKESEMQWAAGPRSQKVIGRSRKHGSVNRMRGAIIPVVPGKTLHLSIICGFSPEGYCWLDNNKNNMYHWKGKLLPGKIVLSN